MRPSADKSVRGVTQEGIKNKEELTVRWQRAGALVRFFAPLNNRFVHPALARPDVLFACKAGPEAPSLRPQHTLLPLAALLQTEFNCDYYEGEEKELVKTVLSAQSSSASSGFLTNVAAAGPLPRTRRRPDGNRQMNNGFTASAALGYDEMRVAGAAIMQPKEGTKRRFERIAFLSSGTPEANAARTEFIARYGTIDPESADVVVALGGDGLMLQTLHRFMGKNKPIYGMKQGSVGFLMNEFHGPDLDDRLDRAEASIVHPLLMEATRSSGEMIKARAINEVSILRQSYQAAKMRISLDGKERLGELIADGIIVATPVGSTAYNLSAHGPILPLDATLMPLTPIAAFRPRRWRGALLPDTARVTLDILEPDKRPVSAVADHFEARNVTKVSVAMDHATGLVLLHDPGHSLDERILREQFGY